jgi:hypothetical protein
MKKSARKFASKPAKREAVGLLIGLVGPSGVGKTFSGLRLATGMQRVAGGEIGVVDTESRRALAYADDFKFEHVDFRAPFGPLDYKDALAQTVDSGARIIMIDSASHEHEGEGGVLDMHDAEVDRMAGDDFAKRERVKMAAWIKPKSERRAFINALVQCNRHVILCFRAKEKIKIARGKDPEPLGWQIIGSEELSYELTLQFLLKPGAKGVPTWSSELESERALMKVPRQFADWFGGEPKQIDEDLGERLAQWARGDTLPRATVRAEKAAAAMSSSVDELVADYDKCSEQRRFKALEDRRTALWKKATPPADKARMKSASDAAIKRMASPPAEWKKRFGAARTRKDLETAWKECLREHANQVPLDTEVFYTDRREAIEEREAIAAGAA